MWLVNLITKITNNWLIGWMDKWMKEWRKGGKMLFSADCNVHLDYKNNSIYSIATKYLHHSFKRTKIKYSVQYCNLQNKYRLHLATIII